MRETERTRETESERERERLISPIILSPAVEKCNRPPPQCKSLSLREKKMA